MNFYECCDLTKKVYLWYIHTFLLVHTLCHLYLESVSIFCTSSRQALLLTHCCSRWCHMICRREWLEREESCAVAFWQNLSINVMLLSPAKGRKNAFFFIMFIHNTYRYYRYIDKYSTYTQVWWFFISIHCYSLFEKSQHIGKYQKGVGTYSDWS